MTPKNYCLHKLKLTTDKAFNGYKIKKDYPMNCMGYWKLKTIDFIFRHA